MIYLIQTGGTIGSSRGADGSVSPDPQTVSSLISTCPDAEFTALTPLNILSENLEASHLHTIIEETGRVLEDSSAEGVIITHGTDTLQYTAAILSYVFADARVPIVMVSSNRILDDDKANGKVNFYFAVRFIQEHCGKGVFVSYTNDGEHPVIHRGNRLGNPVVFSDYVYSVRGQFYGSFPTADPADSTTWENAEYEPCHAYSVSPDNVEMLSRTELVLEDTTRGILRVHAAPGIVYPTIPEYTRAVLLHSYHSGTLCLDLRLQTFLEEAHGRDIPVFLLGIAGDCVRYETMKPYEEYGIIPLYDLAPIAGYCKLWLLLASGVDIVDTMLTPACFER